MDISQSDTTDLLKRVRRIELRTRRQSNQLFSGEYHSAFKGRGMAFSEVREYSPGDEIRIIDWNVTARTGIPHVKVFEEERELTVMLLIDVSASDDFGTQAMSKRDMITEISAVLSFSAIQNNDKVGVIFFSDKVEKFIPPKKGRSHILQIIRTLLDFKPESSGTDIAEALRYLNNVVKKRSIAFVLSDFMDEGYLNPLKIAGRRHDCIGLQISDRREMELPNIGLALFKDEETGTEKWVDTSSKKVRDRYSKKAQDYQIKLKESFKKAGVDYEQVFTDSDYIAPLMKLFKRR
ncbi:MAG: DUF58 domain-containing protein [Flavobacteriales bacterium]|nr:DUF58 domain-containing protein [Flavobacteriales bacterium]